MVYQELKDQGEKLRESVEANTTLAREIRQSTAGLVEVWGDMRGAIRLTAVVGRILKWGAGTAAALSAIWYAINHIDAP